MFNRHLFETQRCCRVCTDGATATVVVSKHFYDRAHSLIAGLHKVLVAFCRFLAGVLDF